MDVGITHIASLKPDPTNARKRGPRAEAMLVKSLHEVGAARSIVIDEDGRILAGNGTVEAAAEAGIERVQVVDADGETIVAVRRSGLTEEQKRRLSILDNRTGELAEWNTDVLSDLLNEGLELGDLWDDKELETLLRGVQGQDGLLPGADPDTIPEQVDTRCKPGDLWRLGDHMLLCGDSTKREDVERLLNGFVPFLCVTDPPYGVSYDPGWRNEAAEAGHLAYAPVRVGEVTNDDRADWREAWELFPGDVIYTWHPAGAPSLVHAAALQETGFILRMQIIWAKSNFPIGRGDYHVRHEPCWYAVRKNCPARRTDDRTQTTLWEINLDRNVEGGHSTQKPLECMARPIRNHHTEGVYDPFLGSGTTLIAAEQLGRKCYGLEISEVYCDIILARWEACTGREAELIEHGTTN